MNITEKAAYLKGLAEGMNLDADKPETKLINAMLDTINDLALTVADLEDEVDTLNAYIEEIDEDLGDVEEYIYGPDDCDCGCDCDDDWSWCDDEDEDCDCGCCDCEAEATEE